jgi:hypothetical protein
MRRRTFLALTGACALAGCADEGEDDEPPDEGDETEEGDDGSSEFEEIEDTDEGDEDDDAEDTDEDGEDEGDDDDDPEETSDDADDTDEEDDTEEDDGDADEGESQDDDEEDDEEDDGDEDDEEDGDEDDEEDDDEDEGDEEDDGEEDEEGESEDEEDEERYVFTVSVIDYLSLHPIEGASVEVTGDESYEGTTGHTGEVAFEVPEGEYLPRASADGYAADEDERPRVVDDSKETSVALYPGDGEGEGEETELGEVLEVSELAAAADSPDEEYVELTNTGEEDVDLTGFELWDRPGGVVQQSGAPEGPFVFPEFLLEPGSSVRVWTGEGSDDGENLYWGQSTQVWNREGDRVRLFDADGEFVLEARFNF